MEMIARVISDPFLVRNTFACTEVAKRTYPKNTVEKVMTDMHPSALAHLFGEIMERYRMLFFPLPADLFGGSHSTTYIRDRDLLSKIIVDNALELAWDIIFNYHGDKIDSVKELSEYSYEESDEDLEEECYNSTHIDPNPTKRIRLCDFDE